jgi:hypothetical protein
MALTDFGFNRHHLVLQNFSVCEALTDTFSFNRQSPLKLKMSINGHNSNKCRFTAKIILNHSTHNIKINIKYCKKELLKYSSLV